MSRLRRGTSWFAVLLALHVAREAQAQDFTLPPTGIIPNYDRVAIGQNEALEGGAYVARTNDAGANWYNPAGLAQVDKVSVNAAASGYEVTRTTLEGLGAETSRTRFTPVGRFFGVVVGRPIVKSRDIRVGFSFGRPVGWEPGVIESSITFAPAGGGTETLGFNSLVSFSTSMPSVGAGWRLSDRLRVGAGATFAITNIGVAQLLSDRFQQGTTAEALDRVVTIEGSTRQFIFAGGVQWQPTEHLHLGAQVRTPGLRVGGSATVVYERAAFGSGGVDDLTFRDQKATFRYKYPLNLIGGVAWVDSAWALEVNLRHHGSVSEYNLLESALTGQRVVILPGADPIVSQAGFEAVPQAAKSIVNLAVGGSLRVARSVRLHAGFFTDRSPIGNGETSIFREMNLTGGSVGASLAVGRLAGSLGFTGSFGTSAPRDIGPSLSGSFTETRIKARTLSFIYALSYNF